MQWKQAFLETASNNDLVLGRNLKEYVSVLLFMAAHPAHNTELEFIKKEFKRVAVFLKKSTPQSRNQLLNSGLPYTPIVSQFSHDMTEWLMKQSWLVTTIDEVLTPTTSYNQILKHTLPAIETAETTAGYSNKTLMETLGVKAKDELKMLIEQSSKLSHMPLLKDQLYSGLGIYTRHVPKDGAFSLQANLIAPQALYYHDHILRKFDHLTLLNSTLPSPESLNQTQRNNLNRVIKTSLVLLARETDTATYMDESSIRYYQLERGISIAIYGMTADRQLPLESYIGYTLFKNGYPAAYGGGWVFGKRANFGINIFEWFRGGESGYMMCQLLRVYRQVFDVDYFEVEPYQYGLDNPEGIASGAFWFYYRFGFRPLDATLRKLADTEFKKISVQQNYRSSEKVLLRFTESNIALNLSHKIPLTAYEVTLKARNVFNRQHGGNRVEATKKIVNAFIKDTGANIQYFNQDEIAVMEQIAMLALVLKVNCAKNKQLLLSMIKTKPSNPYEYQSLLMKLLS